jgi:hypothetical protein
MNTEPGPIHVADGFPTEPTPPYLTPSEVAIRWRRHPVTIRRMFRNHPGVLKLGWDHYRELLIPESLVVDLERRLAR